MVAILSVATSTKLHQQEQPAFSDPSIEPEQACRRLYSGEPIVDHTRQLPDP
jgi:hypothetical protein